MTRTILSGDLANDDGPSFSNYGDNVYNVVRSVSNDASAVLDGFTITGGSADDPGVQTYGGGIHLSPGCTPVISNCTIVRNRAGNGGGVASNSASPLFVNCRFLGNLASTSIVPGQGDGGGVRTDGASVTFINCEFSGNVADHNGGGLYNYAALNPLQSVYLTNCTFSRNSAATWGGGAYVGNSSIINNCIFWNDTAPVGFAITAYQANLTLNRVAMQPGGYTDVNGGGLAFDSSGPWDPLFVDDDGPDNVAGTPDDDLRLGGGSECIDRGDNDAFPAGTVIDLDGNPRFFDDVCVTDTGTGIAPLVDLGAHEHQGAIQPPVSRLYVKSDAAGAGTGTSWADAFADMEPAIAEARAINCTGIEIWVASGMYVPTSRSNPLDPRSATFGLINGVAIYGGFAGTESSLSDRDLGSPANASVLSGDVNGDDGPSFSNYGDNVYNVVRSVSNDASAVLDGFTITGGSADDPGVQTYGGGIHLSPGCTPVISNCTIVRNRAGNGGGVASNSASPLFVNCRFLGNLASTSIVPGQGDGGGVRTDGASVTFINCEFSGNVADHNGGGLYNYAALNPLQSVYLTNCTFSRNSAATWGGGAYVGNSSIINNCIFWNDTAPVGFAITAYQANLTLNRVAMQPGGYTDVNGGGLAFDSSGPWDPLFVDDDGPDNVAGTIDDDLGLGDYSPCIDRGDNQSLPLDTADIDRDGVRSEVLPLDLSENPRQVDDPTQVDTGSGVSPFVDLGAHEAAVDRFFVVSRNPVAVLEGASAEFTVHLNTDPGQLITVDVQCESGESHISIEAGSTLQFDSGNYGDPQVVVLRAANDADNVRETARIVVSAESHPSAFVTAIETDKELNSHLYVNADAADGGDGLSWTSSFRSLQDALDAAQTAGGFFTEIWVASGMYVPTSRSNPLDPRSATFGLINGVAIYGGFAGTESSLSDRDLGSPANASVLSGDVNGDDGPSFSNYGDNVYNVVRSVSNDASAVLDGFTITGGSADDPGVQTYGGGIHLSPGCTPVISNCTIVRNRAGNGGGVASNSASPLFVNCRFLGNLASTSIVPGQGDGGGVRTDGASVTFINCEFSGNVADHNGGGLYNYAALNPLQSVYLTNCTFSRNSAATWGGGAYVGNSSIINNCIFWNDTAPVGFAITAYQANLTLNRVAMQPGGYTDVNGGGLAFDSSGPWDPLFVDDDGPDNVAGTPDDDLRLGGGSECIDRGDSSVIPIGVDIVHNVRRVDAPAVADTGGGVSPFADLGAYEFSSTLIPSRLYVSASANGSQLSTSWSDASNSLTHVLGTAMAATGRIGEIWVAGGVYSPDGGYAPMGGSSHALGSLDQNAVFRLLSGVSIYGGFAGTETDLSERDLGIPANASILAGDLNADNAPLPPGGPAPPSWNDDSYHVVSAGGTDSSAILDGFTISGGNANGLFPLDSGAGLYLVAGRPTLRNVHIVGNVAEAEGGGIWSDFSRITIDALTLDRNESPVGDLGVLSRNGVYLQGPLLIPGEGPVPQTLELHSVQFDGSGGIQIGRGASLHVTRSPPYDPVVFRTEISGLGSIVIDAGQRAVLEGGAIVDLSGELPTGDCATTSPESWGSITINGELVVRDATVQNTNVAVTLAGLESGTNIVNNDIRLVQSSPGFGGQFVVSPGATIACNIITSEGDRYLDLDPDPATRGQVTLIDNKFYVVIKQGVTGDQGELLELRTEDHDLSVGGGLSGAYLLANSVGYSDTWVLEQLEVLPDAKVNLTNRPGFVFQDPQISAFEALYVKQLKMHPGAVLNTGLQRMYYQSMVDENDSPMGPPDVDGFLPNGARLVDTPLLGFSLKIISMEDDTEFAVRVRPRVRDPDDVQVCQCTKTCPDPEDVDPSLCKEGSIERITDPEGANNSVMEMKTHGDGMESASSVAAHGAFARAGEDQIVVAFQYLFCGNVTDQLVVYLSDSPEAGENLVEVARITPPASGSGSIGSGEFATFSGLFSRGSLNFRRGTYVQLELVGEDACVLIDEWDPLACGSPECGDYDLSYFISNVDLLYGLTALGNEVGETNSCLDKVNRDNYVDVNDVLLSDALYGYGVTNLCNGAGDSSTLATTSAVSAPQGRLLISGKPNVGGDLGDRLYPVDASTAVSDPSIAPPVQAGDPYYGPRGHGRLIRDGSGGLYQLHSVLGLIRLSDGHVMIAPGEQSFNGITLRLGMPAMGSGMPIFDAAFDPNDATAVYVVPARIIPPSGEENAYYTAAKLHLTENAGVVTWTVEQTYGYDPQTDPNNNTQPPQYSQTNVQYLREIETDSSGDLYVTCARADNQNDWLLIYDTVAGTPSEQRMRLSDLATPVRGPAALHVTNDGTRLYLGTSLDEGDPMTTTVQEFAQGGTAGAVTVTPSRVIEVGNMRFATSIAEDENGTVYVVGYTGPVLDPSSIQFNENDSLFTTATLAEIPPTGTTTTATPITGADAALPISAVFMTSSGACLIGDVDGSGTIDIADIPVLVSVLLNGPNDAEQACRADANEDQVLNGNDVFSFVESLVGG
ncbi:MAG: hypothetical protein H6818_23610 [Phycisphaerales bacterium]|nr:hypothetical protein [Phycisphaerales bacterium]MCB9864467.1 hypothetical protein [Phycisphaerales bacterium]